MKIRIEVVCVSADGREQHRQLSGFDRQELAMEIHPMNNLVAQLEQIGLRALPANLDDFLARATRAHWSPLMLLEQLAQAESEDRSRRSMERRLHVSGIKSFEPMAYYE